MSTRRNTFSGVGSGVERTDQREVDTLDDRSRTSRPDVPHFHYTTDSKLLCTPSIIDTTLRVGSRGVPRSDSDVKGVW